MISTMHAKGFATLSRVLDNGAVAALIETFTSLTANTSPHALRNLLAHAVIRGLARSANVLNPVAEILGEHARPVRALFFDKTTDANWAVPWHQDRSIAVRERLDTPGYGPWSTKADVVHVQPPRAVLENMLTVRLHLDESSADNGPLRVVPGSHAHGVLPAHDVEARVAAGPVVECPVPLCGALFMRPLILHASSKARVPGHRRVVHIEYANVELANGLRWVDAWT